MTLQEAFDKNWQHFVVEKHGESVHDGTCMYRAPNGNRCGIGILIPDDEYNARIEKNNVGVLIEKKILPPSLRSIAENALAGLQACHDSSGSLEFSYDITDRLRDFAAEYKLTVPN